MCSVGFLWENEECKDRNDELLKSTTFCSTVKLGLLIHFSGEKRHFQWKGIICNSSDVFSARVGY